MDRVELFVFSCIAQRTDVGLKHKRKFLTIVRLTPVSKSTFDSL